MSRTPSTSRTTLTRRLWFGRVALIAVGFLATSAGTAWAYFSASGTGTYGAALAGALTPPQNFDASVTSSSQVTLSWAAPVTLPPGTYTYALTGTLGPSGTGACVASMPSTTTTCTVAGLTGSTAYTWTLAVTYYTWVSAQVGATTTTFVTSPSLVGVGAPSTWAVHTSPSTKSVAYPAGVGTTDVLVLIAARSHNNTVACPTGWTTRAAVAPHTGAAHAFLGVCSLVYTGGTHVTVTVTGTSLRGVTAEIAAFSHVTTATPFDGTGATSASGAGAATFTPGSITSTAAGDLALAVVMENDATTTIPTLTLSTAQGFTATTSHGVSTTTSNAISFATKSIPTPGTITFPTWTTTNSGLWAGASLALKPDPPSGPPPAAALVQGASATSASAVTSVTLTLPTSPTAGDALSLSIALPPGGATVSVVSGGGVTWQKAVSTSAASAVGDAEVWDGFSSTGGTGTVTVTFSTSTPVVLASLSEWRGVASPGATGQASGTGTTLSAGAVGTASDDLVVSAAVTSSASGAVSVDAPFTAMSATGTVTGFSAANTAVGPSAISWSTAGAGSWVAVVATFSATG